MSRDRGSATVWAAVVATALVAVFGGVLLLGQAVVARHRAAAAADLAALAAAASWTHGPVAACASALRVARAQGALMTACAVSGELADVTARVPTGPFTPTSTSRAGPADPNPPRAPAAGPGPRPGPVRSGPRLGPVRSGPVAPPRPSAGFPNPPPARPAVGPWPGGG
ncbi:Rv3654c family TadE-like protein [Streptomyces sp. NPDC002138]|uniref:Rv3654c family TadE-like protein n=1 Tax=Streptomyces sp. NPDC002138 TaxID=3154410 RepID=UPI003317E9F5